MSFVGEFDGLPLDGLLAVAQTASAAEAGESLGRPNRSLRDFARLISPAAGGLLETLGRRSQALTRQRFGRVIRFFAPLYLSNECINNCQYCGFSRDNPILRVTLSVADVLEEARALRAQGFRNLLLVAGEHPKFISDAYLVELRPGLARANARPVARTGSDGHRPVPRPGRGRRRWFGRLSGNV